ESHRLVPSCWGHGTGVISLCRRVGAMARESSARAVVLEPWRGSDELVAAFCCRGTGGISPCRRAEAMARESSARAVVLLPWHGSHQPVPSFRCHGAKTMSGAPTMSKDRIKRPGITRCRVFINHVSVFILNIRADR